MTDAEKLQIAVDALEKALNPPDGWSIRAILQQALDRIREQPKGDYGEPWRFDGSSALDRDGEPIVSPKLCQRAVACVNALAGKNPEALEQLLDAVRDAVSREIALPINTAPSLYQALKRFEGTDE